MNVDFDSSEVVRLGVDLGLSPAQVALGVAAVVLKGAVNIKTQMAAEAASSGTTRHFAGAISYDATDEGLGAVGYVIGPDKDRPQGPLGNILYFGTRDRAPVLDLMGPLEAEEPRFIAALQAVGSL